MRSVNNRVTRPHSAVRKSSNQILKSYRNLKKSVLAAAIFLIALPSLVFAQGTASSVSVTTVVTVMGSNHSAPPAIAKEDVNVTEGKTRLNVTGWAPVQSSGHGHLQLAILIDNALRTSIEGQQIDDLRNFITSLPPSTSVGVFYGMNGAAEPAAPFSTNHQAVAEKLRLSMGRSGGDSPSIYLSLADLVSHWEPQASTRREVLLLSSGVDALNPGVEDPYFDSTLDKVQSAGVVVHTIYDGSNRFGSTFRGDISQGKLAQITSESGGEGFFDGTGAPVSIAPYLNRLNQILANQYLLTFTTARSKHEKGELRSIEIRLEQRDVKVSYPKRILVPGN